MTQTATYNWSLLISQCVGRAQRLDASALCASCHGGEAFSFCHLSVISIKRVAQIIPDIHCQMKLADIFTSVNWVNPTLTHTSQQWRVALHIISVSVMFSGKKKCLKFTFGVRLPVHWKLVRKQSLFVSFWHASPLKQDAFTWEAKLHNLNG